MSYGVETGNLTTDYADVTSLGAGDTLRTIRKLLVINPSTTQTLLVRITATGNPISIPPNASGTAQFEYPIEHQNGDPLKLGGTNRLQWKCGASTITGALCIWQGV